jgi:hypothetical protein
LVFFKNNLAAMDHYYHYRNSHDSFQRQIKFSGEVEHVTVQIKVVHRYTFFYLMLELDILYICENKLLETVIDSVN